MQLLNFLSGLLWNNTAITALCTGIRKLTVSVVHSCLFLLQDVSGKTRKSVTGLSLVFCLFVCLWHLFRSAIGIYCQKCSFWTENWLQSYQSTKTITSCALPHFQLVGLNCAFSSVGLGYIISCVDDKMCNHWIHFITLGWESVRVFHWDFRYRCQQRYLAQLQIRG